MTTDKELTCAASGSDRVSGRTDERSRRLPAGRRRWLFFGSVILTIVALIVLILWVVTSGSEDSYDFSEPLHEVGPTWAEIAAQVPLDPGRRYSDEELGLYDLIDEVVYFRPYYAQFRTRDDYFADFGARRDAIPTEVEGHERERLQFEIVMEGVLDGAYVDLPSDLGPDGPLEQAYDDWMADCAAEAGFADVVLADETDAELERYESEFGLSAEDFYDLRHGCARRAAYYPTLETGVRDEMLGRLKQHYLQAVYDVIRRSEIVEIPVDYREGVPRPLEDSYIQHCLKFDVASRESCAENWRVELTDEQKTAPAQTAPSRDFEELGPFPLIGQQCSFHEDIPGYVNIDIEGRYCSRFEDLEFIINYPETITSQSLVRGLGDHGPRLLLCPDHWTIDDQDKCRYPHPEHVPIREALLLEKHPDLAREPLWGAGYSDEY